MIKSKMNYFILINSLFITPVYSQIFTGEATHINKEKAKSHAMADLQQNIYVNVESLTKIQQSNDGTDSFSFTSKLSSTIPILGSKSNCFNAFKEVHCEVTLDTTNSASMYESSILQKQKQIDAQWKKTQSIKSVQIKYKALSKLLVLIQETQQLTLVLSIIDPNAEINEALTTSSDVSLAILSLEKVASGLPMAAKLLNKKITAQLLPQNKILVKPFTPYESSEITPFASALQTELSNVVNAVLTNKEAKYILQGKYSSTKNHINIETQLVDKNGSIINATVLSIDIKSIEQFDYQPKELDFERLLYSGKIVNQSFTNKLTTNKGQRDLLFHKGENIKLLVKVNKPSYFYIVGHINTKQQRLSYLLDLNDAEREDKFISYLGVDEVNKWVVIGEFEVQPPYGSESLQLFSSTTKPIGTLPNTKYNGDYYVISGSRLENINKTRGIVRKKKSSNSKNEITEAVINLTTAH